MFYLHDFIICLKLKLVQKVGDFHFNHVWKDIVLNQVNQPDHPGICFENSLIKPNFSFTYDLIDCYVHWKETAAKQTQSCINHCIWGNSLIKDIGSKMWNIALINYNINYLTDFVNCEGEVMSYKEFCRTTLSGCRHIITNREYVDIKMAIRRFSNPDVPQRNLKNINLNLALKFYINHTSSQLKCQKIRKFITSKVDLNDILPLKTWTTALGLNANGIDWKQVFKILYSGFTKNYKLIQFQYKLLMRISTCRYMRHKMNIDKVSPVCFHCGTELETLNHIFLECQKITPLISYVDSCIKENIDNDYTDINSVFYLTCSHDNSSINFIWVATKQYISMQFQHQNSLSLLGLKNYIKSLLYGESTTQQQIIESALV